MWRWEEVSYSHIFRYSLCYQWELLLLESCAEWLITDSANLLHTFVLQSTNTETLGKFRYRFTLKKNTLLKNCKTAATSIFCRTNFDCCSRNREWLIGPQTAGRRMVFLCRSSVFRGFLPKWVLKIQPHGGWLCFENSLRWCGEDAIFYCRLRGSLKTKQSLRCYLCRIVSPNPKGNCMCVSLHGILKSVNSGSVRRGSAMRSVLNERLVSKRQYPMAGRHVAMQMRRSA